MFKKQGVLFLMGFLFLIFGLHSAPASSLEAAAVSFETLPDFSQLCFQPGG